MAGSLEQIEKRLARLEQRLAQLLDEPAADPKTQKNKYFDPKYFAARVRDVGLVQAAAEHNQNR